MRQREEWKKAAEEELEGRDDDDDKAGEKQEAGRGTGRVREKGREGSKGRRRRAEQGEE